MTEEEAYWLGFLFADGCVNKYRADLRLSAKDKIHAEKFAKYIGVTCSEYISKANGKEYPAVRVTKNSKEYVSYLGQYGIIPNKTKIQNECPIRYIDNNLRHHWLRGYFDGDGTIVIKKSGQPVVGFCCHSKTILEDIKEYLLSVLDLNDVKIIRDSGSFKLRWGGSKQVVKMRNLLYCNAAIMIDRKKDKFDSVEITEKGKKSKYLGVSPSFKKWQARIKINNKTKYLGTFDSEIQAAYAYDEEAKILGRKTNF